MPTADTPDHEFGFELRVCRWAERHWPPIGGGDAAGPSTAEGPSVVVGRQIGTRRRRWDTVVVEVDREGLRRRAAFGAEPLDSDLLHVVRSAPVDWTWYRDALPDPGYPWRYVREAVHRAADRGVVETRQGANNRIELRRIAPYPDWVERVIAIENKPDLDASAADALRDQLALDVAAGLADEVWVATAATGERIEPVLLEALPDAAGVLTLDFDATTEGRADPADVAWFPRSLDVSSPGVRVTDRSEWAVRFEYLEPAEKAERRLVLAERAYGRGWRSYVDTMRPDCAHFELRYGACPGGDPAADGAALVPYCAAKDREPTAAECSQSCGSCSPEPPQWRQGGWPIKGGPGSRLRDLLTARRRRRRPGLDDEA